MTDTNDTVEAELPELTQPDAFEEFTDRGLLEFIAARFNDICGAVLNVAGSAPEMFEKFTSPMAQLAIKGFIRMMDK